MSLLLKKLRDKPTPFLVLGAISIVCSVPLFIYSIGLPGGGSLIALAYVYLFYYSLIGFAIDHVASKFFDFKVVCLLESILLLIVYVLYLNESKTAFVESEGSKYSYLIVVDSPRGITLNEFSRKGLFDRQLEVGNKNLIYLNESSFSSYSLKVEGSNSVNPRMYFRYKPEYIFNWTLVLKSDSLVYNEKVRLIA